MKSYNSRMDSNFVSQPEVLIVGAGPTGLVMAYELARRGVRLRLIDRNEGPAEQSRALLLQVRSLEVFHFMGLLQEMLQSGQEIGQINLFIHHRLAFQARFQALKSPFPFPLVLPQNDTEQILLSALEKKGICIERQTELLEFSQDAEGVCVVLRKKEREEKLRTAWLIGCDGAHSVVRHGLNLPFEGAAYAQLFSLADVELQSELQSNEIYLFFEQKGFFALLPMRKGWTRLITIDPSKAPAPEPTIEDFQRGVNQFIPGKGKIIKTHWLAHFHLHHRGASRYQRDRVFIAGDAAHIHSPAGGQGMNTGIQDAFNLAWKLASVIQNKAPLSLLETYSPERQPVGNRVLHSTDRFFNTIASQTLFSRFLRNHALPLVAKFILPRLVEKIAFFVSQLQVNYRKSSIVSEAPSQHWKSEAPRPGERAPDGIFFDLLEQKNRKLFELFQSTKYVAFIFGEKRDQEKALKTLGALKEKLPQELECVVILENSLRSLYGISQTGIYLIRPDRYIAYRQQGLDLPNFEKYLEKHFP